jgi:hypothetical protein
MLLVRVWSPIGDRPDPGHHRVRAKRRLHQYLCQALPHCRDGRAPTYFLPDGGTVIADVGRLVFDAEGNVTFEAGPHPALHGDFAALCAALS